MGQCVRFSVNIDPKPAPRPRARKCGKFVQIYMPDTYTKYKQPISWQARLAMHNRKPFTMPVLAIIRFNIEPPRSWSKKKKMQAIQGDIQPESHTVGDIDNLIKGVLDACNGIVFKDDALVVGIVSLKAYNMEPGIEVTICEYDDKLKEIFQSNINQFKAA